MSGSHARHLERRLGIFYLRVRVPDDIRSLVGLTEVRRSLQTYHPARARTLAAISAVRVFEVFRMAKSGEFSKDQVRYALSACYREMAAEIEQATSGRFTEWERWEQLCCSSDVAADAQLARDGYAYNHHVKLIAQRALVSSGLALEGLPVERQDDLLDGAARVLIEIERLRQFRLHDRLSCFSPADPLFGGLSQPSRLPEADVGPALGDAIDAYLSVKKQNWTDKTHAIRDRHLGYLKEHFGPERTLSSIATGDMREFRDCVRMLRRSQGKSRRRSFLERQTNNPQHRVSDNTAALVFVPIQAFLRWCVSEQGYIDKNPAQNLRMPSTKRSKGSGARRPFHREELFTLFSAPVFTGCQGIKRRLLAGEHVFRDAYFWIPILGLYTGARLGELVQLHSADVMAEGDIHYLHVTEDRMAPGSAEDRKHVKSAAAVRKIPLHPDLIRLGFLDFVLERRKRLKRSRRLFWEVKFGADGQASTVFSKWFGRLMGRIGLSDPALVFHSFRHNAEDAFRDALQPQYVIDRIIGHSDGATSALYGDGASLQVRYDAICSMKLPVRLPEILSGDLAAKERQS